MQVYKLECTDCKLVGAEDIQERQQKAYKQNAFLAV